MFPLKMLRVLPLVVFSLAGLIHGQQVTFLDASSQRVIAGGNNQWRAWGRIADNPLMPFSSGIFTPRPAPVPLTIGAIAASAGRNHGLYVTTTGDVLSSGLDRFGERGRGTGATYPLPSALTPSVEDAPTPTVFIGSTVGVEAGWNISFAWDANGTLSACGDGSLGGFGTGVSMPATDIPMIVPVPASVIEVATHGSIMVARDNQGRVWHWGATGTPASFVPVTQVPGLVNATAVAANLVTGYAITGNGSLWRWTLANPNPVVIGGLPPIQAIAVSETMTIALSVGGIPWCVVGEFPRAWGYLDAISSFGIAGPPAPPRMIASLSNIIDIAATQSSAYALDSFGSVWGWGAIDGATGLGLGGDSLQANFPQRIPLTTANLMPVETSVSCGGPGGLGPLLTSSVATLGAELTITSIASLSDNWLFVAPGPAETTPWFPLAPCAAFLSPTGLQSYINQGIGPFPAQRFGIGSSAVLPFWLFRVPDDPSILGMTFSAQAVILTPTQPQLYPVLSNAFTFTIQ